MMNISDLDQRRNRILELVIECYLSTASPVGSELVARKLRSTLSSATIRNIMLELERAGLLEQPHTSAGRVPTDRGYRFYVDAVMEIRHASAEELQELEERIQPVGVDVDELVSRASSVLSKLTQQVAFAVAPTVKRSTVKQVELVPISVRKLLCVLVASEEMVASHVIELTEPMTREEAAALARFINTELVGLSFRDLPGSLERRMLAEGDSFYHFLKRSLAILQHALSSEPDERFYLEGTGYVVSQPEFSRDTVKARRLLEGLDAEAALLRQVREDIRPDGVQVRIGDEVRVPGLDACSYLTAPFSVGHEMIGGVGVLGPKRMDYPRLRALVEGMGRRLTEVLTNWDARG